MTIYQIHKYIFVSHFSRCNNLFLLRRKNLSHSLVLPMTITILYLYPYYCLTLKYKVFSIKYFISYKIYLFLNRLFTFLRALPSIKDLKSEEELRRFTKKKEKYEEIIRVSLESFSVDQNYWNFLTNI